MFVAYLYAETLPWFSAIGRRRITPRAEQLLTGINNSSRYIACSSNCSPKIQVFT
jgi:hypothetical protein